MSKLLSLAALTALAAATFEKNTDIAKVFATADGNIFLPSSENYAINHGRQEKLTVYTITRAQAAEAKASGATEGEKNDQGEGGADSSQAPADGGKDADAPTAPKTKKAPAGDAAANA